jgi:hypothetical protein
MTISDLTRKNCRGAIIKTGGNHYRITDINSSDRLTFETLDNSLLSTGQVFLIICLLIP